MNKQKFAIKINQLREGGLLDHLLTEIKTDIALKIVSSHPQDVTQREDLYMLTQALKCLEEKLQEYVNIYENNLQG